MNSINEQKIIDTHIHLWDLNKYSYDWITNSSNDKLAFKHPAIFPEELVKDHISSWSNENDLIYDCFMGSGTTAKCAHLLKRK